MRLEYLIVSVIIMLAVLLVVLIIAKEIVPGFADFLKDALSMFGPK